MPSLFRLIRWRVAVAASALLLCSPALAQPTYDQIVGQIKAGDLAVDYDRLRQAFAQGPGYDPYDGQERRLASEMREARRAGRCPEAIAKADEILAANFTSIDAHLHRKSCLEEAGDQAGADRALTIARGLVESILRSGNGRTPETAMTVISIAEEYNVLSFLNLRRLRQSAIRVGDSTYDRLEVQAPGSPETSFIWFNIDHLTRKPPGGPAAR